MALRVVAVVVVVELVGAREFVVEDEVIELVQRWKAAAVVVVAVEAMVVANHSNY